MGRTRSLRAGLVPAALAALVLGGPGAGGAPAHTRLAASDPGAGAVLSRAPDAVRLHFSEPLTAALSSARVLAPDGRAVAGARVRVDGADRRVMVVRLPRLGRGTYSTLWTAVGTTDPHRARGLVVFRVGPGAAPASTTPRDPPPFLAVLLRWAQFALLAGVIGALAVIGLVLRPCRRGAAPAAATTCRRAERRLLGLAVACGATALALGIFSLPLDALVMMAWEPESSVELLGQTRWGRLWFAQEVLLASLVCAVVFLRLHAASELGLRLVAALAAALAVVRAADGHAAEVSPHTALSVVVLALHTLAAAVWVGGIVALVVGFWPLLRRDELRMVWVPFGRLAAGSVCLLAVTGLYTAGRQVASLDALVTTLYGQGLGVKVVLLAVAGALATLGTAVLHPTLTRRIAARRLPRLRTLVVGEAAAGLAIVLAAALMSSAPPARGPEFDAAAAVPGSRTSGGGDTLVTLSATPNRPGQNMLTAVVASTRRPDPPPPSGLELRFPGRGTTATMRAVAPGRFLLTGDQLSAGGRSRILAVVHRRGEPDRTVAFEWTTGSAPRTTVISDRPLEPFLTAAAALLALAVAAAAAFAVSRRRPRRPVISSPFRPLADARKDPS